MRAALLGVQSQEEPEVRMGLDDARLAIGGAALIEVQAAVWLQHGIQAVQHSRVAKVGVVQQHPISLLDCPCQSTINPLKPASHVFVTCLAWSTAAI